MDNPNQPSTSRASYNRKRPLTNAELEETLNSQLSDTEVLSGESSDSDFSSDDSVQDKNYEMGNDSESEDDSCDSSDSECIENDQNISNQGQNIHEWDQVTGAHQKVFQFDDQFGVNPNLDIQNISVLDSYKLFVSDEILQIIVTETNRNADQVIRKKGLLRKKSRLAAWKQTDIDEIKKFIGLLVYMGLVRFPTIVSYWSKNKIYKNSIAAQIMSRNRFQSLLRFWHFSDNESPDASNSRLYKIDNLVSFFNRKYKGIMKPDQYIAVDETMIPFRGRLGFRQYIPGKRHKYGVKVFKLCDRKGYTHSLSVYQGKHDRNPETSLSTEVVMTLCENYLDHGRVVVTDNFYTSIDLAQRLLNRKTHTVGTLRKNRKGTPKEIIKEKLKTGEIAGRENNSGIVIAKWKDKREVYILSTYHTLDITNTGKKNRKREDIVKPQSIIDYNSGKAGIDLSDQLSSYSTCVRKSLRWYHKVATELLMGTTVVNSFIVYKCGNPDKKISITQYREELVSSLLSLERENDRLQINKQKHSHVIEETGEKCKRNRKIRKRCTNCYKKNSVEHGFQLAAKMTKKVTTFCSSCPDKPFICMKCFPTHI